MRLFLLWSLLFPFPFWVSAGFELPASWGEKDELVLIASGSMTGSTVRITIAKKECTLRETLEGQLTEISFILEKEELERLLVFLKTKQFNRLVSKKVKSNIYDTDSKYLQWKSAGKVLFQVGYDKGLKVREAHRKYFDAIVLHLIHLADHKTEKQRKKVRFQIDTSVQNSGLTFGYQLNGSGQRGIFHPKEIPENIEFSLFPFKHSIYFYLTDSEKAMANVDPGTIWTNFEFTSETEMQFLLRFEKGKLIIEKR